jgi:hypothetical protein
LVRENRNYPPLLLLRLLFSSRFGGRIVHFLSCVDTKLENIAMSSHFIHENYLCVMGSFFSGDTIDASEGCKTTSPFRKMYDNSVTLSFSGSSVFSFFALKSISSTVTRLQASTRTDS